MVYCLYLDGFCGVLNNVACRSSAGVPASLRSDGCSRIKSGVARFRPGLRGGVCECHLNRPFVWRQVVNFDRSRRFGCSVNVWMLQRFFPRPSSRVSRLNVAAWRRVASLQKLILFQLLLSPPRSPKIHDPHSFLVFNSLLAFVLRVQPSATLWKSSIKDIPPRCKI